MIKELAAYVPNDDGNSVIAILSNFSNLGKLNKNGKHLIADLRPAFREWVGSEAVRNVWSG